MIDNFVKFGIGSRDVSSKVLIKKSILEAKRFHLIDEIFLNEYVSHFTNAVTADKSSAIKL